MTDYCSPSKNKGNICFSKESLLKLIESWNSTNKNNKIIVKKNSSIKTLWNLLDNKLKGVCDKGADWCWVGAIENMTSKVLEYAVYDVLYLVSLFEKITKTSNNYNKIIPEITRNIFFYKRIENKYFIKINETVNKLLLQNTIMEII
jgi:hypothetical protein